MASSGNFSTMNPLSPTSNSTVYSKGNLTTSPGSSWSTTTFCKSTLSIPKDKKIYMEMRLDVQDGEYVVLGCATNLAVPTSNNSGGDGSVTFTSNAKYVNGTRTLSYMSVASNTDIQQIAIDGATNKVWIGLNNTWQGSGDPANGSNEAGTINTSATLGEDVFIVTQQNSASTVTMNFGQDDTFGGTVTAAGNADGNGFGVFKYAPPTGFLALCSGNLSVSDDIDPAQTDDDIPTKQFNVVTWTGNGTNGRAISLDMAPDLVIIKERGSANNWYWTDSSRGAAIKLFSNIAQAEATDTTELQSFTSTGFTIGTGGGSNNNNDTYCGWGWRANGGTTSTNSDGSTDSTVQANTKAGFSIITYAGNGSNRTIGHGLSSAPDFMIHKNRDTSNNWVVYSRSQGAGNRGQLNTGNAWGSSSTSFQSTDPTSSVISLGTSSGTNASGNNFVCYAWHSVEGFSKFGTYTGNGNADGTFIYTGFRPAFIFLKNAEQSASWLLHDNKRDTHNPVNEILLWNTSDAEFESGDRVDFLSNGFKLRNSNAGMNGSGTNYIYGAWGDVPFKYNNTFLGDNNMWALIKDNKIEQIYQRPKSLVIGEVRYPSNMFTKYTDAEKAAIGIYPVEDSGTKGNDRFENTSQATYTWSASDKKVTTSYTITDKSLVDTEAKDESGNNILDEKGNKTYNYGLKTQAKEKAKQQANDYIKQFNWLVERSIYDSSKTIPSAVGTYVGNIKADCATIEAVIDAASDMAAFKKLYDWEYNEDGSVKTIAPIQNWSDDYDVKEYIR